MNNLLQWVQLAVGVGTLATMLFAFYTFVRKPHDTLESRVKTLEVKTKEIEDSLHLGNDKFREQDETNEVLIRSVFALLEFEVHYCETEQKPISKNLEKAKDDLHDYLARK